MKKILIVLSLLTTLVSARAQLLFSDNFNYPNGSVESDGLWYCATTSPSQDANVTNNLLVLISGNHDAVAAPTNGVAAHAAGTVYGSFTINVSQLPSKTGGYFCEFIDSTGTTNGAHIFIDTENTVVPGTYRLGIGNVATSITAAGTTNYPMDLATGITYQVVFNWDETANEFGGTLWINPSSAGDQNVFATDTITNDLTAVSAIEFSPYGGVQNIGNVMIGLNFSDVMTNVAQLPMIGVQPQPTSIYSGNNYSLYTAASGMDVTYQWLSNNVPMVDDGVKVVGSHSNVLNLTNLQNTASYSVAVTDSAGSVTSSVAQVTVNSTPTPPFFTLQPTGGTKSLLSAINLSALADGTGPISYQWYFEPADGGTFSAISGATSSTYSFSGTYGSSGSYYVTATGGDGSRNSATAVITVVPPPLTPIAYLHTYLTNYNGNSGNLAGGQIFNVEGIVTCIGQVESKTTPEFFIQDSSGGCLVYGGGLNISNLPPVGALVHVISPAESYYGGVEMDPTAGAATNLIAVLSTNNPLPAPIPVSVPMIAFGSNMVLSPFGSNYECSLITLTNVYLYASKTGGAFSQPNFPTNSATTLYVFQQPYYSGEPYTEIYQYTYTNAYNNSLNTNFWGKPIPGFASEITGIFGVYAPTTVNVYPTRFQDYVTTVPATFPAAAKITNGMAALTWPAVVGQTYSVYTAPNVAGPWTQAAFGLGYYPSVGAFTDTNAPTAAEFYRVSTP